VSSPKKLSDRAARRAGARAADKLARDRERLARLSPGGSPDNPIEVTSASLVEPRARSMPCPRCEGEPLVEEHTAIVVDDRRLRVARTACKACGSRREIYFRIGTTLAS
jgi:hypothetical protein